MKHIVLLLNTSPTLRKMKQILRTRLCTKLVNPQPNREKIQNNIYNILNMVKRASNSPEGVI